MPRIDWCRIRFICGFVWLPTLSCFAPIFLFGIIYTVFKWRRKIYGWYVLLLTCAFRSIPLIITASYEFRKGATTQQIKKAYRSLSLQYHHDKIKHRQNTELTFEHINTAYETLINEETRSVYDYELNGGDSQGMRDFYIYNREIENIISGRQFQKSVLSSSDIWVIKYYLPRCWPCQQFASAFKQVSAMMENANVNKRQRFGAINCEAHMAMCKNMRIHSFPAIRMFYAHDTGLLYSRPNMYKFPDLTSQSLVD